MATYVMGIDPGLKGGIAILDSIGGLDLLMDMPVCQKKETKKQWVDGYTLAAKLQIWQVAMGDMQLVAAIEDVHAMPGQGVTSMFSFGHSLGVVHGIVMSIPSAVTWVRPQIWKKHFGLGAAKGEAYQKACQLYPDDISSFATVRGRQLDGRVEAVLIARYLWETRNG